MVCVGRRGDDENIGMLGGDQSRGVFVDVLDTEPRGDPPTCAGQGLASADNFDFPNQAARRKVNSLGGAAKTTEPQTHHG